MISLIFCGDLKYCPYIKRYTDRLDAYKIEYKVYFWNRSSFVMRLPKNYEYFNLNSSLKKNKALKIFDFIKFRKWVINLIKKDKPKKVIFLSTLTGVLLGKYCINHKINYSFDIRDYSYEHIRLFYKIEKKVIEKSVFTCISSKGFEDFLPKHNYVLAHNFNRNDCANKHIFKKRNGPIILTWNGVIRYFDFQKEYINKLQNDERFKLYYHGDGPDYEELKEYVKKNNINNVFLTGPYDNTEKEELLSNSCILNNCYGYLNNPGNKLKYAISNRFYDGLIYHIPQLVEIEGFKTNLVLKLNIGINLELTNNFANDLFNYYQTIDENKFNESCDLALQKIIMEDDNYIQAIDNFIVK